jgi:hypothetical protein
MEDVTADVECFKNYFMVLFRKISDGSTIYFDKHNDSPLDKKSLLKILKRFRIVTFNGIKYDQLMIEAALADHTNKGLYNISSSIIAEKLWPWQARQRFGIPRIDINHVDIMQVAPLRASLKLYAARMHAPKIQDLPIHYSLGVDEFDIDLIVDYCGNDNLDTVLLRKTLSEQMKMRVELSKEYGIDLRSKSDAQIAEAVIKKEIQDTYGVKVENQKIKPGTEYYFEAPEYLKFKTPQLKEILGLYKYNPFFVLPNGRMSLPKEFSQSELLNKNKFKIGNTTYKIGIGGIHSCEKSQAEESDDNYIIRDYDVESYYPKIIIENELSPVHLGEMFLKIFIKFTNKRLEDKKKGKGGKLKIVINGTFGKLSEKFSVLYAPDLGMHVTVIGQLSLLMLIEEMELNGIRVISANTDGIVCKIPNDEWSLDLAGEIIEHWEKETNYKMEAKDYKGIYSRDVNSYIAVYEDEKSKEIKVKAKGSSFTDSQTEEKLLWMNPTGDICAIAIQEYLRVGKPIEETINKCDDIRQFIHVRNVKDGGVKGKEFLGRVVRWYYGKNEKGAINYKTNGNKVATTDGAVPAMELPKEFPKDVDKDRYIKQAYKLLKSLGVKEVN